MWWGMAVTRGGHVNGSSSHSGHQSMAHKLQGISVFSSTNIVIKFHFVPWIEIAWRLHATKQKTWILLQCFRLGWQLRVCSVASYCSNNDLLLTVRCSPWYIKYIHLKFYNGQWIWRKKCQLIKASTVGHCWERCFGDRCEADNDTTQCSNSGVKVKTALSSEWTFIPSYNCLMSINIPNWV